MATEMEIQERVERLAQSLQEKGLAWSKSQALAQARDIVMQEVRSQAQFEAMKDDATKNPQQRKTVPPEVLRKSGGMLTGSELDDVPLAELLKGRREKSE